MDREAFNFNRGIRANSNSWAHIRTTSNRFIIKKNLTSKPQIKSNQLLWDCGLRDNGDTWTQRRDCLDISDSVWDGDDGGEHEEGAVAPPPLRRGDKEAQRESLSHSTKAPFLCILVRLSTITQDLLLLPLTPQASAISDGDWSTRYVASA